MTNQFQENHQKRLLSAQTENFITLKILFFHFPLSVKNRGFFFPCFTSTPKANLNQRRRRGYHYALRGGQKVSLAHISSTATILQLPIRFFSLVLATSFILAQAHPCTWAPLTLPWWCGMEIGIGLPPLFPRSCVGGGGGGGGRTKRIRLGRSGGLGRGARRDRRRFPA